MKNEQENIGSGDGIALFSGKHSRASVLGASLFLEALFPDKSAAEINELVPWVQQQFVDEVVDERSKVIDILLGAAKEVRDYGNGCQDDTWERGWMDACTDMLSRLEFAAEGIKEGK